jgi:hypothetical protein
MALGWDQDQPHGNTKLTRTTTPDNLAHRSSSSSFLSSWHPVRNPAESSRWGSQEKKEVRRTHKKLAKNNSESDPRICLVGSPRRMQKEIGGCGTRPPPSHHPSPGRGLGVSHHCGFFLNLKHFSFEAFHSFHGRFHGPRAPGTGISKQRRIAKTASVG